MTTTEEVVGVVPDWAIGNYGLGFGFGAGYGFGSEPGYGAGYGFGSEPGYGAGAGYVESVIDAEVVEITVGTLIALGACDGGVQDFMRVFPNGAGYPRDLEIAKKTNIDTAWLAAELGLFVEVTVET